MKNGHITRKLAWWICFLGSWCRKSTCYSLLNLNWREFLFHDEHGWKSGELCKENWRFLRCKFFKVIYACCSYDGFVKTIPLFVSTEAKYTHEFYNIYTSSHPPWDWWATHSLFLRIGNCVFSITLRGNSVVSSWICFPIITSSSPFRVTEVSIGM